MKLNIYFIFRRCGCEKKPNITCIENTLHVRKIVWGPSAENIGKNIRALSVSRKKMNSEFDRINTIFSLWYDALSYNYIKLLRAMSAYTQTHTHKKLRNFFKITFHHQADDDNGNARTHMENVFWSQSQIYDFVITSSIKCMRNKKKYFCQIWCEIYEQ